MRAKKNNEIIATICLYGTHVFGAGWIACVNDGSPSGKMLGNGELKSTLSMTEAIWIAADELRGEGVTRGTVRIFEPNGQLCSDVEIGWLIPTFGDLKWKPAPVHVISTGKLLEHASAEQV